MPTFEEIYAHHAHRYDELVSHEDYQHNLLPALNAIRPLRGLRVVELGAGTGRLTRLIAPLAGAVCALDLSAAMLAVAQTTLTAMGRANGWAVCADHRALPVQAGWADVALAGWTFGHMPTWFAADWRAQLTVALGEMRRVLRPGGTLIIIETLGTGTTIAAPPTQALGAYYRVLQDQHGFSPRVIRTDYRFESVGEAENLIRFFFGDALGDRVAAEGWTIVPESTGIWSATR
ncbi:MAG: methyltransferase domain-containing protein [Chloroflexi bacterium]|nr:methyltransferase domain-containing protein [Chloroflexota bacterium]